jgi:hypothetical protein
VNLVYLDTGPLKGLLDPNDAMASREGAAVLTFDRHHFGLMGADVYG